MTALAVVLVLSPVLVYLVAALIEKRRVVASSEFFLAAGQVSSFEFANSSIGYGFQIASVSIFFAWGYLYGFGALVNPVFWGVGIALFAWLLPRMTSYLGSGKTLHGYLGERYNSRTLEVVASLVTLIGFLGTFVAELAWGSAVFKMFSPNPLIVGAILTGMAIVIAIYLVRAGQLNAMRTDQVQLIFTYFGFLALGVALIWLAATGDADAKAMSFILSGDLALCLVIMAIMIWRQIKVERRLATSERFALTQFVRPVLLALLAIAVFILAANLFRSWPSGDSVRTAVTSPGFFNLSQGTANLLSLALLPLFWQFVDVTMWQRLAAVQLPPTGSLRERLRPIRIGLQRFAFESPVTWLFAIIIGIALRYVPIGVIEETIWDGIGSIPIALRDSQHALGQAIGVGLALAFGAAIVAAMLSTADSMLMGALVVFSLDLAPKAGQVAEPCPSTATSASAIKTGRAAIVIFIATGLGIIWFQLLTGVQVLPILLGAYAAQISLAACVLGTLLLPSNTVSREWAIASIIAGILAAGYATVVALRNAEWQLYAPLFALGASIPVYLAGMAMGGVARSRGVSIRFWLLTLGLLAVQAAWVVYAVLAVKGIQVQDGTGKPLTFWLLWEMASIVVTLVVTVVFWTSCFMREDGTAVFEGSKSRYTAFAVLLLLVFAVGFLGAAWCAWKHVSMTLQVFLLVVGVLGTIGLQALAMASTHQALKERKELLDDRSTQRKTKIASEVRVILGNRDNVSKYLCFSDVPIGFAIVSIAVLVIVQDNFSVPFDEEQMRSFIAGAVAVQLLYSNFVFWLEAYADTPRGYARLGRLPTWLRSIRHMLYPAGHLPDAANVKWAKDILAQFFPCPDTPMDVSAVALKSDDGETSRSKQKET